jgi:hypothetical protein
MMVEGVVWLGNFVLKVEPVSLAEGYGSGE